MKVAISFIYQIYTVLTSRYAARRPIDIPYDKLLSKLAITYGTLRRLEISEERVVQCLEAIDTAEIDDASDWVCTQSVGTGTTSELTFLQLFANCSEEELKISRASSIHYQGLLVNAFQRMSPV